MRLILEVRAAHYRLYRRRLWGLDRWWGFWLGDIGSIFQRSNNVVDKRLCVYCLLANKVPRNRSMRSVSRRVLTVFAQEVF